MARTSKADRETQQKWESKIRRALDVRDKWRKDFKVDLARDYFEGRQAPQGVNPDEWYCINQVYSTLKAQLPALYQNDPYFYVKLRRSYKPMGDGDWEQWRLKGEMRGHMLNAWKEESSLKNKIRVAIQDAHFEFGVVKVHYSAERGEPVLDEAGEQKIGESGRPIYLTENGMVQCTRVHPIDFVWDEDAGTLPDEWTWVAQRVRKTWAEVKNNPDYNKAAVKSLETKSAPDEPTRDEDKARKERKKGDVAGKTEQVRTSDRDDREAPEYVIVWEIYQLKTRKWLEIAEGAETPLRSEEDFPESMTADGPFSILRFTLRDDSPYPIPPMSQGLDAQREYNEARSKIMVHRKRFNRKYVMFGEAFDEPENEASKMETGDDGTVLMSKLPMSLGISPVVPIQDAPLDQMRYNELTFLRQDMVELFGGATQESRGIAGADSATQAGILEKRMELREGDALSMVIDFVKKVAEKADRCLAIHVTQDQAVRIIGPQGEEWQVVKADAYQADPDIDWAMDVNVGSTIPKLPQMERAQWMAFLQLIASAPQLMLSPSLLREMAQMHHIDNEQMIDELLKIGQMMQQQSQAQAGGGERPGVGSLPNVSQTNPQSVQGGQAGGPQSLMLPGAGNFQQ